MLFSSCEKDTYSEITNTQTNSVIVQEFSASDILFSSNNNLLKKIDEISTLKSNKTSKLIYNETYNFYIDTENGKYVKKGDYESYTFPIYRDAPNKNIENIIFSLNSNGQYDAFLAKYELTPEELDIFSKEELSMRKVTFTPIKYNLTARLAPVCIYIWEIVDTGDLVGADSAKHTEWILMGQYCTTGNSKEENGAPQPTPGNPYDTGNSGGSPNNGDPGIITAPVKGHGLYTEEELAAHLQLCSDLKTSLSLTTTQYNWIKKPINMGVVDEFNNLLVNYENSVESKNFIKQIIDQLIANTTLKLDVFSSFLSPINIDRTKITNATPEGAKFNQAYDALIRSPEFKKLFVDLFENSNKFNVTFEINDHVYKDNNPLNKEVNATTSRASGTNNLTIKISKQILIAGSNRSQTTIENVKTILHECIHAYLFIKANNPTVGADIVKILNTMYPTENEQHDFMYDKMIPTMQKVLSEIRDLVTTLPKRITLEQYTMHPTLSPMISSPFNWLDYYRNLSLSGLDETNCFKKDFPNPSDALRLHQNYIDAGKNELDR